MRLCSLLLTLIVVLTISATSGGSIRTPPVTSPELDLTGRTVRADTAALEEELPDGGEQVDSGPSLDPAATKDATLDEKVGWYVVDGGAYRMMTWGATEGLVLNDFEARESTQLLPASDDVFRMLDEDEGEYRVRFRRDESGSIEGFSWTDRRGQEHLARRAPAYAYSQSEVRYRSGAYQLVGLLLRPVQSTPQSAAVMIHGSGEGDRDDFWYLYQADYLARRGIAVLLPDKRGCGKSQGEWQTASFEELAGDAIAGVSLLQSEHGVDPSRIGVVGLSQGGLIAPLAATRSDSVGFVVNVSGSVVTPDEQLRHEMSSHLRSYGTPDFLVPLIAFALQRRAKHRLETWWDRNGDFDVFEHWAELTQPVLVVYGSNDEQDTVPVHRSIERLEEARAESRNRDFTIQVFPNTGHEMDDPESGWIRTEYLEFLASWILNRAA